jgi:hypothetical protein
MLEDTMAGNNIEVTYHCGNKELIEIIRKLADINLLINKEEIEENLKKRHRKVHLFSRVLKCDECDGNMSYKESYKGYKCATSQKGKRLCTSHSVKEEYLLKVTRESFKNYLDQNINWEELYKLKNKKYITAEGYRKELVRIERELQKIDNQIEILYFDNINESMSFRSFESLMRALQKKQQFLVMKKGNVESLILKNIEEGRAGYKSFKEKLDKILYFRDIDADIIEALIDKILVSENKELKEKKVDVYYKFRKE